LAASGGSQFDDRSSSGVSLSNAQASPSAWFSDGTYIVGTGIQPGTYRTRVASLGCYWERLSGFGGTLDEIIANDFTNATAVVTISPTDAGFKTSRCGTWTTDLSPVALPGRPFSDGTYIVGTDIEPGTYQTGPVSGCYWARLSGFGGTIDEIIANDFTSSPATVTISPSDVGFAASYCGAWTSLGLPVNAEPATYHPVAPARLLDTRDGTGGMGVLHSHVAQGFKVWGSVVPSNATAVTGNLTVTGQTSLGFLFIGPVAMDNPTSSTLNFPTNDDRANAVTVALSASGKLYVTYAAPTASPTAHAIFDVTGYFTPDATGATYHQVAPVRLLDTRDGTGGMSVLRSHVGQGFTVTGAVVPSNATAVTGNLTVTGQTSLGYLFIGPNSMDNPTSSTLNFPIGDDRANAVTVALGAGGKLSITYAAPTSSPIAHAIFDVTGYFTPDSTGALYHSLSPARLLDTRNGTGGMSVLHSHAAQGFTVTGSLVPANATAVTGNLTVTGQTNLGYLFIGPDSMNDPTSSTLNFPTGDDRANAVTVALSSNGGLYVTFAAPTAPPTAHAIFDVTGYFA
jgi:hypothetical protein